ncbi:MAG: glycosyltransferase family 2 protein [Anaerolineae bacterium]|nr:glycosyltransferase family 2 protein [Anaerolineae bacterium]
MAESPSISIVVPVYNSEQSLLLLVERLHPILINISNQFELVLVNDGSRDNSWDVVESLIAKYDWIVGINLMRNFGQHNALLAGIRAVRYDLIVTIDDDLQNPPEEIPKLLDELNKGYDVVYGTPQKMQHGLFRNMASRITKIALQGSMGVNIATKVSAYRVFRTQLREAFKDYRGVYVSIDVLLTWATTKFSAVDVRFDVRQFGQSNYTLMKLIRHAMNMITGFSVLPLQLASILGFTFTVFGILVFLYVMVRFFIDGGVVPGFPFLASIVAIFSGVQLFALGIIGEYLARMHLRLMDRPSYVVRQLIRPDEKANSDD